MPEGLEAEIYRRAAAETIGRVVDRVEVDERQEFASEIADVVPGRPVTGVRRRGKLVIIDFGAARVGSRLGAGGRAEPATVASAVVSAVATSLPVELGLHFGMAGRLIVDGIPAIESLAYSSDRDRSSWDRLVLSFTADSGGGSLRVNDPRRWSRFTLDPDVSRLGRDLFEIDAEDLRSRLARRSIPVKSALLDQSVIAGLGNMLVDELLYHTGIDPRRPSDSVTDGEVSRLVERAEAILPEMLAAGGSHSGVLDPETRRHPQRCPHPDCEGSDHPLQRFEVGGRTTIACGGHQR